MAFKQEGLTSFVEDEKDTPFRFRVSVAGDKLQIWLENLQTKQQWLTTDMAVTDYVDSQSAIPRAQPNDYAKLFAECFLAKPGAGNAPFERTLYNATKSGMRMLSLVLLTTFAFLDTRFEYAFQVSPVALDRVDVLAARVRDLVDENKGLKDEIGTVKDELKGLKQQVEHGGALITLETSAEATSATALPWKMHGSCKADGFALHKAGRTIELVRGGRYVISLHFYSGTATKFEVQVNGTKERALWDSCAEKHHQTLSFVACVPANAQLQVVNVSPNKSSASGLITIAAI